MSKYTKEEIIKDRRSGLKYFDECIKKVGKDELFDEVIRIYKQNPTMWGDGWPNLNWALGNACINKLKRGSIKLGFNLNEALSEEDMQHFSKELNLKIEDYTPSVKRKVIKQLKI